MGLEMPELNHDGNNIEALRHETKREAELIKGRIDNLLLKIDSMNPEMLAVLSKYIHSANSQFDEMAKSNEWQAFLREYKE